MNVKIKLLSETAKTPTRGSEYAAGYDLYADPKDENVTINPGETVMIPTNVAMEIPIGYFGGIYARSGLSIKKGLAPANKVGVIDSDFRAGVVVALHNDSNETRTIEKGERIAQLIIQPFLDVDFNVVDELTDTERGEGGFGSTGTH